MYVFDELNLFQNCFRNDTLLANEGFCIFDKINILHYFEDR